MSIKELSQYTAISVPRLRDMLNASINPIPVYRLNDSIKMKNNLNAMTEKKAFGIANHSFDRVVDEVLKHFSTSHQIL